MRIVNQLNDLDCGIACVAMFANQNYIRVFRLDLLLPSNKKNGLSQNDMKALLSKMTRDSVLLTRKNCSLSDVLDSKAIVLIREKNKRYGHWVCVEHGLIYDPELDSPVVIQDYPRHDWCVLCVLTTANSGGISTHL